MSEAVKTNKFSPKRLFSGIAKFFKDMKSEVKKIVWPTRKQIVNNTIIVIVAMLLVGAFIWALDLLLSYGLSSFFNPKK